MIWIFNIFGLCYGENQMDGIKCSQHNHTHNITCHSLNNSNIKFIILHPTPISQLLLQPLIQSPIQNFFHRPVSSPHIFSDRSPLFHQGNHLVF